MTHLPTKKTEEKRYRIERIYGDCLERIGIRNRGGDGYAIIDKNIVPEVGDIVHCMKPQQNVGGYLKQVKRIEGGTITVGTAYLDETRDYEFEAGEIIGVVVETYGAFPHYREYVRASRDVVEVVRCKDCKHGQNCQRLGVICEYQQDKIQPYRHFCSSGERGRWRE